jgi:YebC/PmpR family DNA-binding regulatory protein
MGRIFEKRKSRMFARYDKMAKAFTKLSKEIFISVKLGGPEPAANPRLRAAIQNARAVNMPKDKVEAAIKRASSRDAEALTEVVYEGYGPHGVAIMVEAATDNANRTVANLRAAFNKGGGSLGNSGSVEFLFQRRGVFELEPGSADADELELELIDCGADDIEVEDGIVTAYTAFENYTSMQKALEEKGVAVRTSEIRRVPTTTVALTDEQSEDLAKLIDKIEEDDDIQNVWHNIE